MLHFTKQQSSNHNPSSICRTDLATLTLLLFSALAVLLTYSNQSSAFPPGDAPAPEAPMIAEASDEAKNQIQTFKVPDNFTVDVFAAEPLVANPVAFFVDYHGNFYVCESFRQNRGVTDNRQHNRAWVDDDLAAQSVDDRIRYHKKHLGDKISEYTRYDDQIRLIRDSNGDGQADSAKVFANQFNQIEDGTAAGVLARNGNVYLTCIPHLWLLRDNDGNNQAEQRESLHNGYGVRVAFRGHDSHGLILGPDNRLYFSIGDRGYNIKTDGKHFKNPQSGAVFRCDLDGSNLEVFATGLRNPQELAFDQFGNLFTGDNNSDSGDRARWVYVVEGGDTGWRMEYQYLSDRGPFNREKIWHPYNEDTPAYIIPPIRNFADGPSGLVFYPGTGLGPEFDNRFLLCDFRGGPANSGIRSFKLEPNGASYKMVDDQQPFWKILATDLAFGADGTLYVSDWVNGWNGLGKGRIYSFTTTNEQARTEGEDTERFLTSDLTEMSDENLVKFLRHKDQRVRQESHLELAGRNSLKHLVFVASESDHQLARLHSMWGLLVIARENIDQRPAVIDQLTELSDDGDAEIRALSARLLGELNADSASDQLVSMLQDDSLRVRHLAATALSYLRAEESIMPLMNAIDENNNVDPVLRHGLILALAANASDTHLVELAAKASPAQRLAIVVALRRQQSDQLAALLLDPTPAVVREAARAIHDLPITNALPQLAALISSPTPDDALMRRVLNANFQLGTSENADRIAQFASRNDITDSLQIEALSMLGDWTEPASRDRVLGAWRPLDERDAEIGRTAFINHLAGILEGSNAVRDHAIKIAASLNIKQIGPVLYAVLTNDAATAVQQSSALASLGIIKDTRHSELVNTSLESRHPLVRATARDQLISIDVTAATKQLARAVRSDNTIERQLAYNSLSKINNSVSEAVMLDALNRLQQKGIPDDTLLDVRLAAASHPSKIVNEQIDRLRSRIPSDKLAAQYMDTLAGGNMSRGRSIFFERTQVSCVRCHKIEGRGGDVGPDLSKIATDKDPKYLMEAIVTPNSATAKGFDSVQIIDANGLVHAGVIRKQTEDAVELVTAEGKRITIARDDIDVMQKAKSPMPEDLIKHLSARDIRDLVAFLRSLKPNSTE